MSSWPVDSDTADAVLLALSELFTNGITHHRVADDEYLCVSLTVNAGPLRRWLAVSVTDEGRGSLRTRPRGGDEEDGRGLLLIMGLGAKITEAVLPGGYQVTAWFADSSELRSRVCKCDCVAWGHDKVGVCTWTLRPDTSPANDDENAGRVGAESICAPCATAVECLATGLATGVDGRVRAAFASRWGH
jgi:hypothetical protein